MLFGKGVELVIRLVVVDGIQQVFQRLLGIVVCQLAEHAVVAVGGGRSGGIDIEHAGGAVLIIFAVAVVVFAALLEGDVRLFARRDVRIGAQHAELVVQAAFRNAESVDAGLAVQAVGRLIAVGVLPDGDVFQSDVAIGVFGGAVVVEGGQIVQHVAVFKVGIGIAAGDHAVALEVVHDGAVKEIFVDEFDVVRHRLRIQVAVQFVCEGVFFAVEFDVYGNFGIFALAAGEHQRAAQKRRRRQGDRAALCQFPAK